LKYYVGIKEKVPPSIFESEEQPNNETHPLFDFFFGPFKSKEDAEKYVKAMNRGVACSEG